MVAIFVKFLSGTNHKPTRLKAYVADGERGEQLTISKGLLEAELVEADIKATYENQCALIAKKLADKCGWPEELIGGETKEGMVFVRKPD